MIQDFANIFAFLSENFIVLSQKNALLLLRIINIKQNRYKYKSFNNTLKNETIKKIIRSLNDFEIITSDVRGNLGVWKIILKDNDFILELTDNIETNYNDNTYKFLFKKKFMKINFNCRN